MRKEISVNEIKTIVCCMDDQETTITYSRGDDTAKIWTSDNTTVTKIKKMLIKQPDKWKCYEGSLDRNGNVTGYFFECPILAISFRSGATKKGRIVSEEERKRISERMRKQ